MSSLSFFSVGQLKKAIGGGMKPLTSPLLGTPLNLVISLHLRICLYYLGVLSFIAGTSYTHKIDAG